MLPAIETMTDSELRDVAKQGDNAQAELGRRAQQRYAVAAERLKAGYKFDPSELTYAATARCKCGAGYAYPKDSSPMGYWECSALLTHAAPMSEAKEKHGEQLPFMYYSVKSENQPSANGATTRPAN
jgi:hypothetical protein